MAETLPAIMTISETSEYLRIPLSSLYKLAQERRIPCQKVGRHWRFRREALDRWLDQMPATPNTLNEFGVSKIGGE
jgi:excisionase family DNA binding protein